MKFQKGFTIIELIVVIAIIAILAAIVLVNVVGYINKSKDAAIQANLDAAKTSAAAYFADEGSGSYTNIDTATTPAAKSFQAATAAAGATPSITSSAFCASKVLSTGHYACLDASGLLTDTTKTCTSNHICE